MGDRYQYSDEYSVYIEEPVFGSSLFTSDFLASPAVNRALNAIVPVVVVLAVIQLLIGGAIELGLKRYNLDLLTR